MEEPNSNCYTLLYLLPIYLQFLCFFSLPSSSVAADSSTNRLRINCGSASTVDDANYGTFTGDKSHKFFRISEGSNTATATPAGTNNSLYQTARIFSQPSRYTLEVAPNSPYYLLRLHFAAFYTQSANLYAAVFHVSTSSKALLRNFSTPNSTVLVSEFYVPVANSSEFRIYFIPAETNTSSSSLSSPLAFVNAIEFLRLPDANLFAHHSQSQAFHTLYRVNVGGGGGGGQDDNENSLRRQWSPDKDYYATPSVGTSRNKSMGARPAYDEDLAPLFILRSCRSETSEINGPNPSNLTWRFQVKRNSKQFVRLYFFNCVGSSPEEFNIYINDFKEPRDDVYTDPQRQEYVVDSGGSEYLNISISPQKAEDMKKSAYLSALEIMEFLPNTTVNDSDIHDENLTNLPRNLVIGLSVAGGLVIALILSIVFVLRFRRRRKKKKNSSDSKSKSKSSTAASGKKFHSWMTVNNNTNSQGSPLPELNLKLKMPLAEILAATDNFNPERLIGSGGFGKVYEGKLVSTGVKVAVKRSEESGHGQGLPEFHTEVLVLSKIRHRHLVSLIGYCDDEDEMILVYEFMKNGTLREYLYTSEHDPPPPFLNWKQRLEICIGSATGLHYLHTGSDGGIIHRDVKTTNILLDDNLVAKVADFGLSQSGPPDPDHHTMALKGSFGYLDPEFFRTLQLTDKSDVYSFGVVMLEVLCARPPIVNSSNAEEINLAEWGLAWQKKGEIEKIVDPLIAGEINPSSLRKYAEVAEKCLRVNGVERPAMLDVCWDLEYALQLQKSTVKRDPSEDSMTMTDGGYSGSVMNIRAVGESFISVDECEEGFSIGGDGFGDSVITDSEMFSHHRIDRSVVDR